MLRDCFTCFKSKFQPSCAFHLREWLLTLKMNSATIQNRVSMILVDAGMEIPDNLKVVNWLPQNDLLGHAKTRAFVSHMGINGATEAAYHGVPLVAACIMSDSYANTVRFTEKAKMAKPIDVYSASADTWLESIEDVIYNSR